MGLRIKERPQPAPAPGWYKDAIFYELRVRAFADSDADGIGDFRGLTSRLDYLADLGVTTLWLLPFYPSPLKDDGYDISDYTAIDPDCGTLDDFRTFLREAHRRELRVVTELVLNHTSDQHPWFQRARRAPAGSRHRNFYVWNDTPERYREARVIFQDFEPSNWTWDPVAQAYFWHRFYAHQPDLNYDSPDVRKAMLRVVDSWLGLGVDGLRLDAVPYLFERPGTSCENLPETHAFLRELRAHVDAKYRDRMLIAEANQWPEDAAAYFGAGDECHMAFHFPVMPRLFMAVHMEDRHPIHDILVQTPAIPESCQWALFLRNHDELTLEMVTDEERDYMYRVYARETRARINLGIRRRLAPLLGNDRRRIELLNALLLSLPGTPVLYYGDEIGMGDNFYLGDRDGVRTPMQWSADRNAGFSRANPQRLYLPVIIDPEYHYESINVEAQQNSSYSLLRWMKRLIALRQRHRAFGRGSIEFLVPHNRKVLAFVRALGDERILVVANLSRYVEYVELDLRAYKGMAAVELFGRQRFPPIGELPYLLTLGPHSFYWFSLEHERAEDWAAGPDARLLPVIRSKGNAEQLVRGAGRAELQAVLPAYLARQPWFAGEGHAVKSVRIGDTVAVADSTGTGYLAFAEVDRRHGASETYVLALKVETGRAANRIRRRTPHALIADLELEGRDDGAVVYDALEDPAFTAALLDLVARRRQLRGSEGELTSTPTRAFRTLRGDADSLGGATALESDRTSTTIVYGERLVLKLFRRLAEGTHPDLEVGRFLTDATPFRHAAAVAGALEYRARREAPTTLAILREFVPHEGDAWSYTLDHLRRFFDEALLHDGDPSVVPLPDWNLLDLAAAEPPSLAVEKIGGFLDTARLLGRRTADLHLALASETTDPDFAPERFTALYQRSLYQSMRNLTARNFRLLRERLDVIPEYAMRGAEHVLERWQEVLDHFQTVAQGRIHATRIRCHGDYHLPRLLLSGRDFVVTDFEGEPERPLPGRRQKHSPLRDVAGMLRSLDYAAHTVLFGSAGVGVIRPQDVTVLEPWARFWRSWVEGAFLGEYLRGVEGAGLLPGERAHVETLLHVLLLEKSVTELGWELVNRPAWVNVPIRGILLLLHTDPHA